MALFSYNLENVATGYRLHEPIWVSYPKVILSLITPHNISLLPFIPSGKASRTVDLQLEAQIEVLRDTQRKYANILKLSRALTSHFYQVVQTQRSLGDAFSELSQKSPELQVGHTSSDFYKHIIMLCVCHYSWSHLKNKCDISMWVTHATGNLTESHKISHQIQAWSWWCHDQYDDVDKCPKPVAAWLWDIVPAARANAKYTQY